MERVTTPVWRRLRLSGRRGSALICCASRAAKISSSVGRTRRRGDTRRRLAGARRRLLAVLLVARELEGRLLPTLLDEPQKEENITHKQKIIDVGA